jgi:DNA mismatch repair protein mutL
MPHIQQLSPHVADLIAAGEVVERPASVVKELLENAIDAGAQSVTVEMKNGGMTYLRVSDDGCGIAPSELPTAFLRHATSKLRTAEDLAAIGTLGFRGEALAAISSVSRLDIFSRERGALSGAKLHLEGGVPGKVEDAGCPEGTSVIVRDLFYNTPARLKFMKRDSAEATAIAGLVAHLALSHPEVSFKLIKDGTQTLLTPGDGALRSAIYASLGREFALSLEEVKGADSELRVTGFISSPLSARGTRGMQTFFVNGRLVKSQLLTAALEEAYANRMMKGKFPGCVLLVELPRDMVDVNVHPAKTIVKFVGEKRIFDLVYHAAMAALDKREKPEPPQAKPAAQVQNPRGDFFANMTSQQYREQQKAETPAAAPAIARPVSAPPSAPKAAPSIAPQWKTRVPAVDTRAGGSAPLSDFVRHEMPVSASAPSAQESQPVQRSVKAVENPAREAVPLPMEEEGNRPVAASPVAEAAKGAAEPVTEPPAVSATKQEEAEAEQASFAPLTAAPWRIAGEVLDTYIVCEDEDKTIWLIDKHAAHERMNFDRLKAAQEPVMCQALLAPLVADFAAEEYSALAANLDLLREFGFECEEFGGGSLILRAIPADLESGDAIPTLEELAEKLVTAHTADPAAARDALLHTMACKAAIKGGWKSDISELRVLVEKVQSGEVQFCPHGRPVKAKLTKYELEKMFKRA